MACIRFRRGRWVCDWRTPDGRRGWKSFRIKEQAERFLGERLRSSGQSLHPAVDPRITLADYAPRWLEHVEATFRHSTFVGYSSALRRHLLPRIGARRVVDVDRQLIRALLAESRKVGFAPNTVRFIYRALASLLQHAVEDGLLLSSPTTGVLRSLGLSASRRLRDEVVAMTGEERDILLAQVEPVYAPILLVMSRTGIRVGEAIALKWEDVDLQGSAITIRSSVTRSRLGPTKTGRTRTVDLSRDAHQQLCELRHARLSKGSPEWVFTSVRGCRVDYPHLDKAFIRARKAAKLPARFTIHSLRHTYAKMILEEGGDVLWLQRQLGHASISMTADLYGRWAEIKRPGLVDRIDGGSSVVGKSARNGGKTP